MDIALQNIRTRSKGTQHSQAILLAAIDSALKESKTPAQPTSYFLALLATIQASPQSSTVNDALSLLNIILPHLPNSILINHRNQLFNLLQLQPLPPTRQIIVILQYLFSNLPSNLLDQTQPRQLFRTILLPLASLPSQPKLRRQAHLALASLKLEHPYGSETAQRILTQLSSSSLDSQTALSLLALALQARHLLSPEPTVQALLNLLQQPTLSNHAFVSERTFDLLDSLASSIPDPFQLLLALIDRPPTDVRSLVGWLATIEHASVASSRKTSSEHQLQMTLTEKERLLKIMNFLGHESGPVRNATRSCIEALIRVCITDTLIEKNLKNEKSSKDLLNELINILTTLIENLDAWSAPTEELANVIEALIGRLRDRSDTGVAAATVLLKHLIKPLGSQRERTGIESVIGKFSSICGPKIIFEILPLDLLEENPKQTDSNSWLIALLNKPGYIINTYLQDFLDRFLTLSEKLFERRKKSLENKELIESKTCETLISQIWSLLPGYCDLPRDLPTAFTTRFAELLAQLLYTQPSLRSSILKSLRNLADRNLSLSKPVPKAADLQLIRTFSISSSQALKNVEILASSSSNMVKVLINLLSRKEEMDTTRAMVIECVRSWIALLSDQDFEQITTTITTALQAHAATPSTSEAAISKLETMLDTYALLVSRLPAHQALELVSSDALLCGPAQKKAYRILASATPSLPSTIAERLLERVIEIGEDPKRIIGGAKADRMALLAGLVGKIGPGRLDLIAGVMAEVVLGCKESNKETRERAYELLVDMGRRMLEQGGTIDRRRVGKQADEEIIEGENEIVQASIDEYLTIVSAGLAGKTPQMISATIMALSRVLFEFHKDLKEESISGLLNLILVFLSESKNREIIKAAIGFAKVSVVTLPQSIIEGQLEDLVKGLMSWADEHRNEIKKNVRHLFERLVRKFGDTKIAGCLNENDEGGKKLVNSIRKCQNREKKRKEEVKKKIGAGTDADVDGEMELDEERRVGLRSSLGDAYEQALYGSDMSDEEVERQLTNKHGRSGGVIEEEEDEVVDLLDSTRITKRAIAGKLAKVEQRREALAAQAAKYKRDSDTGKMMIDDEDEQENQKNNKKFSSQNKAGAEEDELSGMNAYLEAIHGEDGQTRDERGRVKFNKPTKAAAKRSREALEEETLKELEGLEVSSSKEPKKKARKAKEKLGAEFKAKKAGGDMTQTKGVSPYAYLPLSNVSGKKNRAGGSSKIDITGKKRGSRK